MLTSIIAITISILAHLFTTLASELRSTTTPVVFLGDITLWQYLDRWCGVWAYSSRHDLIVVDRLRFANESFESPRGVVRDYLERQLCFYYLYDQVALDELEDKLLTNSAHQHHKLYIIFDLGHQRRYLSEDIFHQLDKFYYRCLSCHFPLTILSDSTTSQLYRLALKVNNQLKRRNFRATLVSTKEHSTAVHIRPVIDGCRQVKDVILATDNFDQLHVDGTHCNLGSTTLNVVVNNNPPYCQFDVVDDHLILRYSLELELLKVLEEHFNFRANLIDAKQMYGSQIARHNWDGAVGHVYNLTADFGLCFISMTQQRQRAVEFSAMINYDQLTFISLHPGVRSRKWMILSPFSSLVWLAILASFLLLAISIEVSLRLLIDRKKGHLVAISVNLVSILLKQQINVIHPLKIVRLLYGLWFVATLILSNSFGGCFYSILAVPESEPPIDSVAKLVELAQSDEVRITTYAHSSYLTGFLEADSGDYYHLGRSINRTQPSMGRHFAEMIAMVERKDQPQPTVFVGGRRVLIFGRRVFAHRPMHIASDEFENDNSGVIFAKRSPLFEPFNRIIKQTFENGLIEKWIVNTFYRTEAAKKVQESTQALVALKLIDFYSILLFWVIGNLSAILVFLCERVSLFFK